MSPREATTPEPAGRETNVYGPDEERLPGKPTIADLTPGVTYRIESFPREATMSITDFLLARIRSDEEEARRDPDCDCFEGDHGQRCGQRWLDECAAKRAIIGQMWDMHEDYRHLETAIAHLAAVYSDHPDYDPSWVVT